MDESFWPDEAGAPPAESVKLVRQAKAREFAQLYNIFVDDDRGVRLLAGWRQALEDRATQPGASHAEYAYYEGQRAFVRGIQRQIGIATTEDFT